MSTAWFYLTFFREKARRGRPAGRWAPPCFGHLQDDPARVAAHPCGCDGPAGCPHEFRVFRVRQDAFGPVPEETRPEGPGLPFPDPQPQENC